MARKKKEVIVEKPVPQDPPYPVESGDPTTDKG